MGSRLQEMNVVYDTGSDWLVIKADDCSNCVGNLYNYENSDSFKRATKIESERNYGSASLKGYESYDRVCLRDTENCVDKFRWFLIEE